MTAIKEQDRSGQVRSGNDPGGLPREVQGSGKEAGNACNKGSGLIRDDRKIKGAGKPAPFFWVHRVTPDSREPLLFNTPNLEY